MSTDKIYEKLILFFLFLPLKAPIIPLSYVTVLLFIISSQSKIWDNGELQSRKPIDIYKSTKNVTVISVVNSLTKIK